MANIHPTETRSANSSYICGVSASPMPLHRPPERPFMTTRTDGPPIVVSAFRTSEAGRHIFDS